MSKYNIKIYNRYKPVAPFAIISYYKKVEIYTISDGNLTIII